MVTDDAALRAVALGPRRRGRGPGPGATLVRDEYREPRVMRELGDVSRPPRRRLLDAPVSGSTVTVEQGRLSSMVGGDPAVLERVPSLALAMGPNVTHVGPLGLAKTMKVATNLGLAVQMLAFSEAVLLAEKAGHRARARGRGAHEVRDRLADGEVPRSVRAGEDAPDAWFKVP